MEQLPSEFINLRWFIAAIAAGIAVIAGVIKVIRSAVDTHDEYYLKRNLKRLTEIKTHISAQSPNVNFVDKRIEEEAFALASGIRVSHEEAKMLREIYLEGFATIRQLKRVAQYLRPVNDKIAIEFGRFAKSEVLYSFWASMLLLIVGMSGLLPLLAKPSFVNFGFAITTFVAAVLVIRFVGADFQNYKTLYFIWHKLNAENKIANPDVSIRVKGVYTPKYLGEYEMEGKKRDSA
ncbi:hypothetical protein [Rheinheimera pleomorphica]|uniref:hypothetical protein n=1 Tax=Rheinheimera pleomorphica TaxID=2703963 RepID=UPI001423ECEA|nr:hypothetical protein [Rheinheimera pleomorphica]